MRRLLSILLWSVLAAAFIGPGTVTTAASAGASFGLSLLWALAFSTLATVVLQEAAARLTVVSGADLGAALKREARGGVRGGLVVLLVLGAVVLGCAAYEAGNILGGVAGAALAVELPRPALTAACGALAALLLAVGSPRQVARGLSLLVAVMGVAFLATAVLLRPEPAALVAATLVPSTPAGSGLLILALVGTTVVPYNLFLGSSLAAGQRLDELRLGIAVAVVLGGLISMGVLVVGTALEGPFGFEALAAVLAGRWGGWAGALFAAGLFAAGLSSAITAPLAAALTARSVFSRADGGSPDPRWGDRSWRFRAVWGAVVAAGVVFGATGVRPVPAIILAQAANGVLLPLVAVFLALAVNDRRRMGADGLNGALANTVLAGVVAVTVVLGVTSLARAGAAVLGLPAPREGALLLAAGVVTVVLAVPVLTAAARRRRLPPHSDSDARWRSTS